MPESEMSFSFNFKFNNAKEFWTFVFIALILLITIYLPKYLQLKEKKNTVELVMTAEENFWVKSSSHKKGAVFKDSSSAKAERTSQSFHGLTAKVEPYRTWQFIFLSNPIHEREEVKWIETKPCFHEVICCEIVCYREGILSTRNAIF